MAIFNINERPGDFLSDNFFVSGTDFNEFKEMVKAVSDTIKYWKVKSDDLPLLSHLGTTDDGEVDYFFTVDPESLDILPNIIGDALQAGGVHLEGYDGETKKLNRVFSKSITNLPKTVLQKKETSTLSSKR